MKSSVLGPVLCFAKVTPVVFNHMMVYLTLTYLSCLYFPSGHLHLTIASILSPTGSYLSFITIIHPSSLHPTLLFDSSIYRSYQVMTWRDMMAVQRNLSSCPQSCIEFWENPVSCIDFQSSCSLHEQVVCLVFTGQRRHNEEIRVNGRTAGGSDPLWTSEGRLVK